MRQAISAFLGMALFYCAGLLADTSAPVSKYEMRVAENVRLAGLLNDGAIESLRTEGAMVIDLRTPKEGTAAEAAQMERAGIEYLSIPVGREPVTEATLAQFSSALAAHNDQPILVHCRSGNRAGLLWAMHRIDQGKSVDEALAEVDPIVTSDALKKAITAHGAK